MSPENFDEKIKEALYKGAYRPTNSMLEKNREEIMAKIEEIEKSRLPGKKFGWNKALGVAAAAIAMAFALSIFTQPGQAALEKLKQYFEPEKVVEYEVEGDKENIDTRLQQSEMGYVLYYDQERYKVVEGQGADRIVMKEEFVGIPEVYMEISQDPNSSAEELAPNLEQELKKDFSKVDPVRRVSEPVESLYIHAIDGGSKADDPIVDYYLVDNGRGGTFIIKLKYFLEAAEGHGARFRNMLKDFTIVDID